MRRIGEEGVDEFAVLFSLAGSPVVRSVEHRDLGGLEVVAEGPIGAQRLLQIGRAGNRNRWSGRRGWR